MQTFVSSKTTKTRHAIPEVQKQGGPLFSLNNQIPRQFQKVSYQNVTSVRFNIQEQKYYENDVSGLPWNIYRIISAITDKEETYALLLCLVDLGVSGSGLQYRALLMFFNDADGFDHKMNNSNFLKSLCKEGLAHSFDTLVRMK